MNKHNKVYNKIARMVLDRGRVKKNRTGTNTISTFGIQVRFDISDGTIPVLTNKKMHLPSIIHELVWYFSGSTNIQYLTDNQVRIWQEWADERGELGPLYGKQLRDFNGVDQLAELVQQLKDDPDSRRLLVSYWNPEVLPDTTIEPKANPVKGLQALAPCHYAWQVWTEIDANGDRRLSLMLNQRSADVFLGVPFNISQYSIIALILCNLTGYKPGEFIWSGGDVHLYENHMEQIQEQLARSDDFAPPTLKFNVDQIDINNFKYSDIEIVGYESHGRIAGKVAI